MLAHHVQDIPAFVVGEGIPRRYLMRSSRILEQVVFLPAIQQHQPDG